MLLDRFLRYVSIPTPSNEANAGAHPSDPSVFHLAHVLEGELRALGLVDVECTESAVVYGVLPATQGCETSPRIGFIAHMDTVGERTGETVVPVVHENYGGGDIDLGPVAIRVADFRYLADCKGMTIVTSDGHSLLGADDKAGVAEIMEMLTRVVRDGIPHGRIAVAFTPDEEIGHGVDTFDIARFACDFAYTVDGGIPVGELEYENFNASMAIFTIKGVSVHPGGAKGLMRNAALVAMEVNACLPALETPAHTCGHEGFYHLESMEGDVEKARLTYIVRDHDAATFAAREATLRHVAKAMNEKYGEGTVELEIRGQYRNMLEKVREKPRCLELAAEAIKALGHDVCSRPIRGGTDGALLSHRGLPTPNLSTGGGGVHGPMEHAVLEYMDECVDILCEIVRRGAAAH